MDHHLAERDAQCRNIKVPDDWFKRNEKKKIDPVRMESQQYKWLRRDDCLELDVDETWFSGHVMGVEQGKYGKYYRIYLTNYKNSETPTNFWGAIGVKFFRSVGFEENFVGFFVDVKMRKKYIDGKSLNIKVKLSDSEHCAHPDEEIDLAEQLGEAETENLLSADWSFLDGIPK